MQAVIHPLTEECINQIAAGEVIERPASVVKELVENAVDAGATQITITLKQGGLDAIWIEDNGCGMQLADLKICHLRYTTSKLRDPAEIFQLLTNGFRGEALSSIAAVSRMKICSHHAAEEHAWSTSLEQGQTLEEPQPDSRQLGTSIYVEDLFFNTPVRKKFLSSANVEHSKCVDVLTRIALARPEISFTLIHDDKEVLHVTSGTLAQRITEIFGVKTAKKMSVISYREAGCEVVGFVGNAETGMQRRTRQYLFLDQRPIENFQMSKALEKSWQSFYPGKHPPAALYFSLPRDEYDINVHPTKKEIRFSKPDEAFSLIHRLVRRALDQVFRPIAVPLPDTESRNPLSYEFEDFEELAHTEAPPVHIEEQDLFAQSGLAFQPASPKQWTEAPQVAPTQPHLRFFQWAKSYIIAETDSGLVVVDQYNAHTRILYDKAFANLTQHKCLPSQQLLFPEILDLSPAMHALMCDNADQLYLLAYDFEPFGKNSIRLRGIPAELPQERSLLALEEFVHSLAEQSESKTTLTEKIALSYARASAIRKGQILNQDEMAHLIHGIFASANPYVCPAGKSIFHRISIEEMVRKFS